LFSVLLHMDMSSHILHTQQLRLLHSWTLVVTDGSPTHQDAWMLPSFTHLLHCTTYSKFLTPPPNGAKAYFGPGPPSLPWLHDHTQTHHTLIGLPSTNNRTDAKTPMWQHKTLTRDRQPCPPPPGFELIISANERRQTHSLHRAANRIGQHLNTVRIRMAQLDEALR
jgi:hypothetical protein